MISVNNRLILEPYKTDGSLQGTVKNGFATVSQKQEVKALKLLVDAKLNDGTVYKAGSLALIPESVMFKAPWATTALSSPEIPEPFILVDFSVVIMIKSIND